MNSEDQVHRPVSWEKIADYVAAGSVARLQIEDLETVHVEIGYENWRDGAMYQGHFALSCLRSRYMDFRRREDHESGASIILEAYLHTESELISDLLQGKLEGLSGPLLSSTMQNSISVYHLEIIGEVSINILCEELRLAAIMPYDKHEA